MKTCILKCLLFYRTACIFRCSCFNDMQNPLNRTCMLFYRTTCQNSWKRKAFYITTCKTTWKYSSFYRILSWECLLGWFCISFYRTTCKTNWKMHVVLFPAENYVVPQNVHFQLKTRMPYYRTIYIFRKTCKTSWKRMSFYRTTRKPGENACRSIERHTKQLMQIIWEWIAFYGTAFKTSWKRMSFCRTTCRISWECTSCWGRHVERCAFSAEI